MYNQPEIQALFLSDYLHKNSPNTMMIPRIKTNIILLLSLLLSTHSGHAGQRRLSNEYKELRKEVIYEIMAEYNQCLNAVDERATIQCTTEDNEEDAEGDCAQSDNTATVRKIDKLEEYSKCEKFKPGKEDFLNRLHELAKQRNIEKYQ